MKAFLNVRPMAITSQTDFICVVKVRSARRSSNAQRDLPATTSSMVRSKDARVSRVDVVRDFVEVISELRSLAAIFAIGNPVAFDASARIAIRADSFR